MNESKPSYVVLGTRFFYDVFHASTTAMSNLDYDIIELSSLIIDICSNAYNVNERLIEFCDSYKTFGSLNNVISNDGLILSNCLRNLAFEILKLLMSLNLYNDDGTLPYRFNDLKHFNIILEYTE